MNRTILLSVFVFSISFSYGQNSSKQYYNLISKADSLYKIKDYKNSAAAFSDAFKINEGKGTLKDRYFAACAWALANKPDSSFIQLNLMVTESKYVYSEYLAADTNFISLHNDKRWNSLIQTIKQNKEKAEANYNKPLVAQLDSINTDDQKGRLQIEEIANKYGWESKEIQALWKTIREKDSVNLIKVKAILEKYGWLSAEIIGEEGNSTLFLVIQHSDQATQEKYLPMMREAVKKGNASASSLALLEDRVALHQGKRQLYGSQVGRDPDTQQFYVLPLEDPDNVDKRRAEVGLSPISEYIGHWGMKWDVEQYKKDLPAMEAKIKSGKK